MNVFEKLNLATNSLESLSSFVKDNSDDLFIFFINQNQLKLHNFKSNIDDFLCKNLRLFKKLDLSTNENQIFIDILIDTAERLNLSLYFKRLCRIKEKKGLSISKRNKVTSLYINKLRRITDFSNIVISLLDKLQDAYQEEEDNNKKVLAVFFNFYANLIRDFSLNNLVGVNSIIGQVKEQKNNYSFLISDVSDRIFKLHITDGKKAFKEIHSILDTYLEREVIYHAYSKAKFLIELETEYSNSLNQIESEISQIRELSIRLFNGSDNIFHSLGRGVAILNEEQQLFLYLKSYGKMHFAKCNYAYNHLPSNFFGENIEIIDWGCGQALASMTYLDFINQKNISQTIKKITLNEPSEIALKRGALHIRKFDNKIETITINKDLNSLRLTDFTSEDCAKLHLFSNILDIDNYSTKKLASLIKEKFKGLNYIVIISPKITNLKTNRIDSFINEFKMLNYTSIIKETKRAGEWEHKWTMVIRIFKVSI